jgi:hypothetical protein
MTYKVRLLQIGHLGVGCDEFSLLMMLVFMDKV